MLALQLISEAMGLILPVMDTADKVAKIVERVKAIADSPTPNDEAGLEQLRRAMDAQRAVLAEKTAELEKDPETDDGEGDDGGDPPQS